MTFFQAPWVPPLKNALDTTFVGTSQADDCSLEVEAVEFTTNDGWDIDF